MQFDQVTALTSHPAWALLRADNAALVLSFCGTVFVDENARGVPETVLESRLDDRLYLLNEENPGSFPRSAGAYLAEWTKNGWLRKYYPPGEDERISTRLRPSRRPWPGCGTCPHVRSSEPSLA